MQIQKIRKMIKKAVAHEKSTGTLAGLTRQFAQARGIYLSSKQVDEVVRFIREYIEHAPALLQQIGSATRKAGIAKEILPILETAEEYFLSPLDLIPDRFGLVGLMDDAYLAHSVIQALSEGYRHQTGTVLVPLDLARANQFIRSLIGEPQASMLDAAVVRSLSVPVLQESFQYLPAFGPDFNMGPDPIWGNATMDEIVDARLGAMGVV